MTPPQHMTALAYGNNLRVLGARFCAEVAALDCAEGRLAVAECLENEDRPEAVDHLRVERFVRAAKAVGPVKGKRILRRAAIYRDMGTKRGRKRRPLQVRDLTDVERKRLAGELRGLRG